MTDSLPGVTAGVPPPAPLVRAELDRILASELFARSERLSSYLRFIVERTLAGDGDSLKEQVIAVELYGKDTSFNPAIDPIVRIDARRLRDKLREYYGGAGEVTLAISVPKGQYTPVFVMNPFAVPPVSVPPEIPTRDPLVNPDPSRGALPERAKRVAGGWPFAAAALVLIAGAMWLVRSRTDDAPAPRLITVTSLPGSEDDPTLSPDGRWVAFSWGGANPEAPADIWIKSVDGEAQRNLTNTPGIDERWARWSPDGKWIAFTRHTKDGVVVVKVSPLGGVEDTIETDASLSSWTPDSRGLVMQWSPPPDHHAYLAYHDLGTGARRVLDDPPRDMADTASRVSPDQKWLAFERTVYGVGRSAIYLMPMVGGTPRLLGEWSSLPAGGLEWMPDGRELLANRTVGGIRRLMRIPADGRDAGAPVPGLPFGTAAISLSQPGADAPLRLAVSAGEPDTGLRLVNLAEPIDGDANLTDTPFCDTSRMETPGQFSRDGGQVAFVSNRSGSFQIYVANRDGTAVRQVTRFEDAAMNLGSFSPDGERLTFAATIRNRTGIYIVSITNGAVSALTDGTWADSDPQWSRDGRWIYFSSDRSGSNNIWKMPIDGGAPTQLTFEAGSDPRESPDGQWIYFLHEPHYGDKPLRRVAVNGGAVESLDVPVTSRAWDVTDSGIVFLARQSEGIQSTRGRNVLQEYLFADQSVRRIGRLGFLLRTIFANRFLAVSADGRWALASHLDHYERDIVVLDGFR